MESTTEVTPDASLGLFIRIQKERSAKPAGRTEHMETSGVWGLRMEVCSFFPFFLTRVFCLFGFRGCTELVHEYILLP